MIRQTDFKQELTDRHVQLIGTLLMKDIYAAVVVLMVAMPIGLTIKSLRTGSVDRMYLWSTVFALFFGALIVGIGFALLGHGIPRTICGPISRVNQTGSFFQVSTRRWFLGLSGRMSAASP